MQHGNVIVFRLICLCLSLSYAITFESLDLEISGVQVQLFT